LVITERTFVGTWRRFIRYVTHCVSDNIVSIYERGQAYIVIIGVKLIYHCFLL